MIEYIIKDPKFFISCMKSISSVVDETVLEFGGKLRSYGMDGGRICLYELLIGKSELEIKSDGKIKVIVCVSDLQKILSRFSNPDELTIQYNDNRITIKGRIANKTKTFRLATLAEDIPPDLISKIMGNLEAKSVFTISLTDFLDMVKDGELYTEHVRIKTVDNKVIIDGNGQVGDFRSEYELDDEVTSEEACQYSIKFIKDIMGTLGNPEVIVSFSTKAPIMIYNKLSKDSHLRWFIAPRVEDDDFEDDEEY